MVYTMVFVAAGAAPAVGVAERRARRRPLRRTTAERAGGLWASRGRAGAPASRCRRGQPRADALQGVTGHKRDSARHSEASATRRLSRRPTTAHEPFSHPRLTSGALPAPLPRTNVRCALPRHPRAWYRARPGAAATARALARAAMAYHGAATDFSPHLSTAEPRCLRREQPFPRYTTSAHSISPLRTNWDAAAGITVDLANLRANRIVPREDPLTHDKSP